jgi:hypothetical protein
MASHHGHCDVAHALVRARADLELGWRGQTPLVVACRQGHTDIVTIIESVSLDFAQQKSHQRARVDADHAASIVFHRSANCVVVNRHRGGGCVLFDHLLQLQSFNTFVAEVRLSSGCFYFEVHVVHIFGIVQLGVCTQGFEPREDEGAGDDA